MSEHLWYLSEELVAFSFFDNTVSFETKQLTFAKLHDEDDEQYFLKTPQHSLGFLRDKHPQNFVTPNTKKFFEILRLDSTFLSKDPRFWLKIETFRSSKLIVKKLRVTNDNAERAIALVLSYNKLLTKDE